MHCCRFKLKNQDKRGLPNTPTMSTLYQFADLRPRLRTKTQFTLEGFCALHKSPVFLLPPQPAMRLKAASSHKDVKHWRKNRAQPALEGCLRPRLIGDTPSGEVGVEQARHVLCRLLGRARHHNFHFGPHIRITTKLGLSAVPMPVCGTHSGRGWSGGDMQPFLKKQPFFKHATKVSLGQVPITEKNKMTKGPIDGQRFGLWTSQETG